MFSKFSYCAFTIGTGSTPAKDMQCSYESWLLDGSPVTLDLSMINPFGISTEDDELVCEGSGNMMSCTLAVLVSSALITVKIKTYCTFNL